MTWLKVDDGFYSHAKVLSIPRAERAEALGTWVLCGTWCADKLTDGRVPVHMVEELGGSMTGAQALVAVRLWRRVRDSFVFVNWTEWQYSREQIETNREHERKRKAAARAKAHGDAGVSGDVPAGQSADTSRTKPVSDIPVQSSPVPTSSTQAKEIRPVLETGAPDGMDGLEYRARLFGFDPARVRQELTKVLREFPDDDQVMHVATTILARAKQIPDDATKYLIGSFRRHPEEAQQLAYGGAA